MFISSSSLDYTLAEEGEFEPIDYSSPVVQSFITIQEARKNEDYDKLWQLTSKRTQMKGFNNDPDYFKKHSREEPHTFLIDRKLKGVKPITDTIVALIFGVNAAGYMIKEDGIWKDGGECRPMLSNVKDDIPKLIKAIGRYLNVNKRLPRELSELVPDYIKKVPADPFAPEDSPYIYKVEGATWMIYSYGPDRKDDKGAIEFDINKGILSQGDIIGAPGREIMFTSVTISGKVDFPSYKEGQRIRIMAQSSPGAKLPDIAFVDISQPGEYSLKVPQNVGDIYIAAVVLEPGETTPHKDSLKQIYDKNPIGVKTEDISGADITLP